MAPKKQKPLTKKQETEKNSVKHSKPNQVTNHASDTKTGRDLRSRKRAVPEVAASETLVKKVKKTAAKPEKKKHRKSNAAVTLDLQWKVVDGIVLTAGEGDVGQLGHGTNLLECPRPRTLQFEKPISDICAGGMHTVLLTTDGEVFTFGCNDENALGRDTSLEGSDSVPMKVDIPYKVIQISAGDSHSAALTVNGKVYAWGNFRDSSGAMGFNPDGSMQKTPLALVPNSTFTKICSGSDHLVMLASNGVPFTLGCAEQGQLGRVAACFTDRGGRRGLERLLSPSPIHTPRLHSECARFQDVWATSHCTFAKTVNGEIWVCGLNNHCQLGMENTVLVQYSFVTSASFNGSEWVQIAGGQHHTMALSAQGNVFACGRKEYGRLGLGKNSTDCSVPTLIDSLVTHKIRNISCGSSNSFAVDEKGDVYSWGMSGNLLGHGNEINNSDIWEPKLIVSKSLGDKRVICVSSGGQHVVILVEKKGD